MRARWSIGFTLAALLFLMSCGAGPSGNPNEIRVSFDASPTIVYTGDPVTLTWSVRNANKVLVEGVEQPRFGSLTVNPQQTTTYTLTAENAEGVRTVSKSITVVTPKADGAVSGVLTWKNSPARLANYSEPSFTTDTVSVSKFGRQVQYQLDGLIMTQPLYVRTLDMGSLGLHDVVFAGTEHGTMYAFDSDGNSVAPLWKRNFLTQGAKPLPDNYGGRSTFEGEIGITGTPAIDPATGHMFFVHTQLAASGQAEQYLHVIDVRTGNDILPARKIVATVPGDGEASANGVITFDPSIQNQRPGLLLMNGVAYVAWGSFSDHGDFHGWVMAYDAGDLHQISVWNSATKYKAKDIGGDHGGGASFWAGGAGIAGDADGNIYLVSGDGTFSADAGDPDYGDAVLKLHLVNNNFEVVDWFTPSNQECLNAADLEIGSGGAALLPDGVVPGMHLVVVVSKEGKLYLLDRDNLGHYAPDDAQVLQSVQVGTSKCVLGQTTGASANSTTWNRLYGTVSYWNGYLYMGPSNGPLRQFKLQNGKVDPTPVAQSASSCGNRGCNTVISSSANGAILWAYEKSTAGPGILHAYDASDISHELWNSNMNASRDGMQTGIGFAVPVVVDGHVITAWHHFLMIYGSLQ